MVHRASAPVSDCPSGCVCPGAAITAEPLCCTGSWVPEGLSCQERRAEFLSCRHILNRIAKQAEESSGRGEGRASCRISLRAGKQRQQQLHRDGPASRKSGPPHLPQMPQTCWYPAPDLAEPCVFSRQPPPAQPAQGTCRFSGSWQPPCANSLRTAALQDCSNCTDQNTSQRHPPRGRPEPCWSLHVTHAHSRGLWTKCRVTEPALLLRSSEVTAIKGSTQ